MIPNPENVFEELQNDVAAKITATAPFNALKMPTGADFQALTEDEGDIQWEFDQMMTFLGLAIVVHSPVGEVELTDMPGPFLGKINFDVWVTEAPLFNRSERGTKVRLSKAMSIIMGTVHGFQPASVNSPLYFTGFKKDRQRNYTNESDRKGTLWVSRILNFVAPAVGIEIGT